MGEEDADRKKDNPLPSPNRPYQDKDDVKLWSIFLFGLIGATATTFAVSIYYYFIFFIGGTRLGKYVLLVTEL